jgi:WD40 repeat protein
MPADIKLTHVAKALPHGSPLVSCRFDPKGRFVFAGAEDNTVQRWDLSKDAKVPLAAHDSWVKSLAFSSDGETLVTGGYDGRLIWWPVAAEKPEPVRKVEAHAGWIRGLSASADGKLLASCGNDRLVKLWNLSDGALVREFSGHESHVYSVLFHPGGQFILSGDLKGVIKQWETATGKLVRSFDAKALHSYNGGQQVDFGGVRGLALSPDGKYLAASGLFNASNPLGAVHDPVVLLFEWESQKLVQTHIAEGLKGVAWRVLYLPDGTLAAVCGGSSGGFLSFWKPDQNKELHRVALPNLARDFDLHAGGIQLAVAHFDRQVRICKMAAKPGG